MISAYILVLTATAPTTAVAAAVATAAAVVLTVVASRVATVFASAAAAGTAQLGGSSDSAAAALAAQRQQWCLWEWQHCYGSSGGPADIGGSVLRAVAVAAVAAAALAPAALAAAGSHVQLYSLGCHKLLDLYPPSPPTCLRTCLADAATAAKIAARKELVKNKTGDELRWLKHKAYYK
jgi:hypothetical protein